MSKYSQGLSCLLQINYSKSLEKRSQQVKAYDELQWHMKLRKTEGRNNLLTNLHETKPRTGDWYGKREMNSQVIPEHIRE